MDIICKPVEACKDGPALASCTLGLGAGGGSEGAELAGAESGSSLGGRSELTSAWVFFSAAVINVSYPEETSSALVPCVPD